MKITMALKRKEDLNVATQVGHTYCILSTPHANLNRNARSTVKARFTDTRLTRIHHYYGQFALSLGKESPCIFSKFNPLIIIRALFVTPSVTVLTGFDCICSIQKKNNR